jgi:hypothetical protein
MKMYGLSSVFKSHPGETFRNCKWLVGGKDTNDNTGVIITDIELYILFHIIFDCFTEQVESAMQMFTPKQLGKGSVHADAKWPPLYLGLFVGRYT